MYVALCFAMYRKVGETMNFPDRGVGQTGSCRKPAMILSGKQIFQWYTEISHILPKGVRIDSEEKK